MEYLDDYSKRLIKNYYDKKAELRKAEEDLLKNLLDNIYKLSRSSGEGK